MEANVPIAPDKLDFDAMPLLEVRDLKIHFRTPEGTVPAVDGISFSLEPGEALALVGESGSGKSVTSLSILGLISPPGFHAGGSVRFRDRDLSAASESEWLRLRGKEMALVFQDPMHALNPVLKCGKQVEEGLRLHLGLGSRQARARALELFREVGIPDPERRLDEYPHQMSGGMRQRVMIASALACGPSLLIADEPTTALDVTVQAQILELLLRERDARKMGLLLVTHDLSVVAETADRVAVMYAGKIVELAPVEDLFARPRHPYTRALLDSIPDLEMDTRDKPGRENPFDGNPLAGKSDDAVPRPRRRLEGNVPDPHRFPSGCRFHPRCPRATGLCAAAEPAFDGRAACYHPLEYAA